MSAHSPFEVRIAPAAHGDLVSIWKWTMRHFGEAAALRYQALIRQALKDLRANPVRPGSKLRRDLLPDLWLYHLAFSRDNVPDEQRVLSPRHFLMFRYLEPHIVEIVRVVHDSRDLARHLPAD